MIRALQAVSLSFDHCWFPIWLPQDGAAPDIILYIVIYFHLSINNYIDYRAILQASSNIVLGARNILVAKPPSDSLYSD